jgi:uncharacterized protein YqeY
MATITDRVQSDMTAAAKAREQKRLGTLRLLLDALKKESKAKQEDLGEEGEIAVLKRERKRRAEAAEAYRAGGRTELAAAEDAEAALIDEYLPAQISDDELEALVTSALEETNAGSPKEMGRVMAAVMPKVGGRADGKRVNEFVREKLAQRSGDSPGEGDGEDH